MCCSKINKMNELMKGKVHSTDTYIMTLIRPSKFYSTFLRLWFSQATEIL